MYQCMAFNDLDTRYSSGQLRVLGDDTSRKKWAPSFAKRPLEEKMFAAMKGNITIKYAHYHYLALLPNFTSDLQFWPLSKNLLCFNKASNFSSKNFPSQNSHANANKNIPKPKKVLKLDSTSLVGYWLSAFFIQSNSTFSETMIASIHTLYRKNLCSYDLLPLPSTLLHSLFNFDTSLFFQPIIFNLFFTKCALKVFVKLFIKNFFSKTIYKRYFKIFFKMLFRNLPKACIKLFFKYSFKMILNILAKAYFCVFLIYLISKGRQRALK